MRTKRGPKPPPDDSPLPFTRSDDDVESFGRFCAEFIRVEKNVPMIVQDWQREIVEMIWGATRPKMAGLAIGRGNSKSSLAAALCLYRLFLDDDIQVDLLAFDERQAGEIGRICTKMINRHPQLAKRAKLYQNRIVVRQSELWWLPAIPAALEGRTPDWTVVDEAGRVDREVFEVAAFSASKKPAAQLFLIGTPGPRPDNVLGEFRDHCLTHPEDTSQRYMEFSAGQWHDHPVDCDDHGDGLGSGCLTAANPALGQWLTRESLLATLPPKMSEQHWRRVRLVQFWATGAENPFVTGDVWDALATGETIPDGARVVLALDGSHSRDHTAILIGTVAPKPHFHPLAVFTPEDSGTGRIDVLAVENAIREACARYHVAEVVADPFRWNRSLQILASEGITVTEFPHSPSRLTKATTDLHTAIVNGQLSHSGAEVLRAHMLAASVIEHGGGLRLGKASRSRHAPKIDLAACLVMAYSRASWLASQKPKRHRVIGV